MGSFNHVYMTRFSGLLFVFLSQIFSDIFFFLHVLFWKIHAILPRRMVRVTRKSFYRRKFRRPAAAVIDRANPRRDPVKGRESNFKSAPSPLASPRIFSPSSNTQADSRPRRGPSRRRICCNRKRDCVCDIKTGDVKLNLSACAPVICILSAEVQA